MITIYIYIYIENVVKYLTRKERKKEGKTNKQISKYNVLKNTMLNGTSKQNIQGVECQKKKENGIITKYCSLNYINTKPTCRELQKMQKNG